MKHFVSIILMMVFLIGLTKADATPGPLLLPRCNQTDFDLCGYIDAEIWEAERREVFVIQPIYEDAYRYSEGLAAVRVNGLYGYINVSDQMVIRPQFNKAGLFDQGLAIAGTAEKLGVIDRSGHYVVDPQFGEAVVFSHNVILAKSAENNSYVSIHEPLNTPYNFSSFYEGGLYNLKTGWLTEEVYSFDRFTTDQRELIWAQVRGGRPGNFDDLYGLMRSDGTWLIEPKYNYGIELKNDLAPVRQKINGEILSGAINGKGQEVIPFKFDYLTNRRDGFLLAGEGSYPNRKFGIVNREGQLLAGRYFDKIENAKNFFGPEKNETDYFTVRDGKDWKTLRRDGTLLPDQRIGTLYLQCDQFTIYFGENGYDLRPRDTKLPVIRFDKPLFSSTNQTCNPPPTLVRGNTYAAVLENGTVFGGFFENSRGFFGNLRWVSVDRKWGLVKANGDYEISPIYDSIQNESDLRVNHDLPSEKANSTYKVSVGDKVYRLIFQQGEYVQEPYRVLEEDRSQLLNCQGDYKRKSEKGLWGLADGNEAYLIPPKYRAISCFSQGVVWVPDDVKRQWCPLDKEGRTRSSPPCRDQHYSMWTSHSSPEKFDDDQYESNVLWMRAWLDYGENRRDEKPKFIPDGNGG